MSEQHIGTWIRCPGCRQGADLDAIGAALFEVGHFNCSSCGARWQECTADGCYGYDPSCPCAQTGWVPYVTMLERLGLTDAPALTERCDRLIASCERQSAEIKALLEQES